MVSKVERFSINITLVSRLQSTNLSRAKTASEKLKRAEVQCRHFSEFFLPFFKHFRQRLPKSTYPTNSKLAKIDLKKCLCQVEVKTVILGLEAWLTFRMCQIEFMQFELKYFRLRGCTEGKIKKFLLQLKHKKNLLHTFVSPPFPWQELIKTLPSSKSL